MGIVRLSLSSICLLLAYALGMAGPVLHANTPVVYLVGDSTVRTLRDGHAGWGDALMPWLPRENAPSIENRARGGASSRSFRDSGDWERIRTALRPGDIVLIQFGHNDQGSPMDSKATLNGTGDDTVTIKGKNGKKDTVVHTYGWYLNRYIDETLERKAIPVVITPVPRNVWRDGKLTTANQVHVEWARTIAATRHVPLLDLNHLVRTQYQQSGKALVSKRFFRKGDETHTTLEGAAVTARIAVSALRTDPDARVRQVFGGK